MKTVMVLLMFLLSACDIGPTDPVPDPIPSPAPAPESHCGDGICQPWDGEGWDWCEDCAYDLPYCGDGWCFGGENEWNCWDDCAPDVGWNPSNPFDPGYIDPRPEIR